MHPKIVAIAFVQFMLAAGAASAQTEAPAAAPPETPPEASAAPVCAGECCVINGALVCTRPPEVPPGTNPVVIVPPESLREWLRTHDPAQIDDYLNMNSGEMHG